MDDFRVDASELVEMGRSYAQAGPIFLEELAKARDRSMYLIEGKAKSLAPSSTGTLQRSITGQPRSIAGATGFAVGTGTTYARYVEEGRRPGSMPPVAPIRDWVVREARYGRKIKHLDIRDQAAVDRVTYLVRWRIFRRGIEPRPYLVPAFTENLPTVLREYRLVPARTLKRLRGAA